jgi:hypothetical protein
MLNPQSIHTDVGTSHYVNISLMDDNKLYLFDDSNVSEVDSYHNSVIRNVRKGREGREGSKDYQIIKPTIILLEKIGPPLQMRGGRKKK